MAPRAYSMKSGQNEATERGLLCFSGISRVHHERPGKESWSERDKAMKSLGSPFAICDPSRPDAVNIPQDVLGSPLALQAP
jgi:hypothetical protein